MADPVSAYNSPVTDQRVLFSATLMWLASGSDGSRLGPAVWSGLFSAGLTEPRSAQRRPARLPADLGRQPKAGRDRDVPRNAALTRRALRDPVALRRVSHARYAVHRVSRDVNFRASARLGMMRGVTRSTFVRQPLDEVVARYDRFAPWYRYLEWTILLAPGFRRRAVQRIGLRPGEGIVEMGCGTGRNLALLREAVGSDGQVIGVDASPGMLAEARKVVAHGGWDNVSLVNADAAALTLDEQVDAAYFSLSYSVMPDRSAALDRAWETVRPGGRLVVMDAGIPREGVAKLLGPLAEIVATAFPGDPYSEPWNDLMRLSESVATERFQAGMYFVCTARKPLPA